MQGINKVKLQHEAGNPPLTVECGYKSMGICQYPLLHDLLRDDREVAKVIKVLDSSGNNILQLGGARQPNTKNRAVDKAAYVQLWKSRVTYTGDNWDKKASIDYDH